MTPNIVHLDHSHPPIFHPHSKFSRLPSYFYLTKASVALIYKTPRGNLAFMVGDILRYQVLDCWPSQGKCQYSWGLFQLTSSLMTLTQWPSWLKNRVWCFTNTALFNEPVLYSDLLFHNTLLICQQSVVHSASLSC